MIWQKLSWLRPCKSAANLFIGPRAAACCRVQCYDFVVRKKLFLKKARVCTCHTLHTGENVYGYAEPH